MTFRPAMALLLCCTPIAGCAGNRMTVAQPPVAGSNAAVVEYVRQLPLGTNVRVDRATARTVKGTLLKIDGQTLIVQARTRVAVPPVEIPLADVTRVTVETGAGSSLAKSIGVGLAAGAGAAAAVILILIAALD
jgi:hypothetical protein